MAEERALVLGAGGFTLSHREPNNRYTYVDIDPAIKGIAEQHFLRKAARGEFIADESGADAQVHVVAGDGVLPP